MSRALFTASSLLALAALAGCLEPSGIENPEELIAAAALRDGSIADPGPAGGSTSAGSGGSSAGGSGSGGAGSGGSSAGSGGSSAGRSGSGGAGSGGSGAGSGGSGGMPASNCGDIVATLLIPTCASEFCHGENGTSPLKLLPEDTAAALIGTEASMTCEGELYIDPAAPENSLLYTKLGEDFPCGLRMPLGGTPVSDAQRACVLEWITEQAAGM